MLIPDGRTFDLFLRVISGQTTKICCKQVFEICFAKRFSKFRCLLGICRFEAGQGYECLAELQEAARRSGHDVVRAWTKFIGAYLSHILRRPLAVYQLASQQVSVSLLK